MRACVVSLLLFAGSAAAQKSTGLSSGAGTAAATAVATWRKGLEVSINGGAWERSSTVALTKAQCPPADGSACAAGSAVGVDLRFPAMPQAVDLSKTRAQLGESSGAAGARYEVRLIRAQSSALCPAGFTTATPHNATRLAINLGAAGPPLPLTCRWT